MPGLEIREFIHKHAIAFEYEPIAKRPDGIMPDMDQHWRCQFRKGRKRMTVYFSGGSMASAPDLQGARVLDCLAMDASYDIYSFETWAYEFGYDHDSRKAEAVYRACQKQSKRLRSFLGEAAYTELLSEVERL